MNAERDDRRERRAKLLDRQPAPVRKDVFLQELSPRTLESLRQAIEAGLALASMAIVESTVILQFTKPGYRGAFPDNQLGGPT